MEDAYSALRTAGLSPTVALLKAAISAQQGPVLVPGLVELFDDYLGVLVARDFRANTVKGYETTRNAVAEWVTILPAGMTVVDYAATAHDGLVGWLRSEKGHG